ncbi:MAG TPA: heme o synthase [Candidatus Thermoplasmatota archaeon]|nr:heme o synthase [Candidatus Thermoplasmatota archaeon]
MDRRVLFERLALATTIATFILMMMGGYVKAIGAGLACPDWPRCYGVWFPFGDNVPTEGEYATMYEGYGTHRVAAEWLHRWVASMVGPMILAVALLSWRLRPVERGVRAFATTALVLLPIQVGFGGWTVLAFLKPLIVVSHLGFATLIFGALVATTVLAYASPHRSAATSGGPEASRGPSVETKAESEPAGAAPGPMTSRPWTGTLQQKLGPWFELVKPGILLLLVLCGAAAMFLAGTPSWRLVAATLFGGALAAASAAAFNNYLDRDRDALLARTRKRSIPSARIPAKAALVFAFVSGAASFAYLAWRVNLLTALLAMAGIVFYVYYTIWLKPSTVQNIVIGGAAGAAPALVGWAAVTGNLALPALILGFIIFAWTPPHFWALALVYKSDYAKGAVPMYPVVKGEAATRKQIFLYTLLTVAATLAFIPFDVLGWIYLVAALVLGAWFVALAARLLVKKDNKAAYAVFGYSIVYLGLLFVAMVADRLVLR